MHSLKTLAACCIHWLQDYRAWLDDYRRQASQSHHEGVHTHALD